MAQSSKTKTKSVASEKIYVGTKKIACDGGDGALGHPRVYLQMDGTNQVECPYCDKLYILKK